MGPFQRHVFVCTTGGTCQLSESGSDAAPPDDGGGTPDAMPVPLESWFVSFQDATIARASDVGAVAGGFALVGSSLVVVVDPRGELRWQRELDRGDRVVHDARHHGCARDRNGAA